MTRKFFACALTILLVGLPLVGQTKESDAEAEKAKAERRAKLIAAIEEDAAELKLPENRAFVNAKIGAAAWKTDPELARKLFRSAVNDLIAAQQMAEAAKDQNRFYDLLNSQSIRPQILSAIAASDAEIALEALYRSRPLAVERALAAAVPTAKSSGPAGNQPYIAQSEINLEQRLIKLAAEQKPEKALALAKETVKKKLSGETLYLLQKIHQTEPASANELANDVVARLASAELYKNDQPNHELLSLSNALIGEFVKERQPEEKYVVLDEVRVRRLAEKVIGLYVSNGQRMGWVPFEQLEPSIRRFSPASYEPLRKIAAAGHRRHGMVTQDPELKKLMESNPSPGALIAAAKNFDPDTRRNVYQNAANKYSETGQYQAGVALLNETLEGEALENALSSMNWYYAHHLVQKGQYDAAEAVMLEFNESNRVSALISLAQTVFNANREENRARAAGILTRVRGMLPDQPENQNQMSQMFALVNATAEIDATEAVGMLEPLVDQLNRLTKAFALVNAYQSGGNVRQGEFVLSNGFSMGVYIDPNMVRNLYQKQPERVFRFVDGFGMREIRIILRLNLLEGMN